MPAVCLCVPRHGTLPRSPAAGAPFYVSLEVRSHSESGLVADIIAHDAEGKVYTRVDGAEVTISAQLNRLFTPARASSMEPIAIIGISCLFPGAHTPDEFWRNLLAETDSTSPATIADMGVPPETFYNPIKGQRDKFYAMRGGYVRNFVFDPSGYRLPAEFLSSLDSFVPLAAVCGSRSPARQRLPGQRGRARTGVVLGNLSFPTKTSQHLFSPIYQAALSNHCRSCCTTRSSNCPAWIAAGGQIPRKRPDLRLSGRGRRAGPGPVQLSTSRWMPPAPPRSTPLSWPVIICRRAKPI